MRSKLLNEKNLFGPYAFKTWKKKGKIFLAKHIIVFRFLHLPTMSSTSSGLQLCH